MALIRLLGDGGPRPRRNANNRHQDQEGERRSNHVPPRQGSQSNSSITQLTTMYDSNVLEPRHSRKLKQREHFAQA